MKIYKDKDLMQQVEEIDLGIVPAGETKRFTFYVRNDSLAFLRNLRFMVEHAEVKVIESPEELAPQTDDTIILEWSPSITLKEGLKTMLRVQGIELWG
jgi:hypothetical protein